MIEVQETHLFRNKPIVVFVHGAKYFLNVSFFSQEFFKWEFAVLVLVKNLEEPFNFSPEQLQIF